MLYRFSKGISSTSIKIWICSLFLVSFSHQPPKSKSWGFVGHKKINELAVYTLPPEMIAFYKANMDYIIENSVLPDKRRYIVKDEGPKHFIDLDHFKKDSLPIDMWVPKAWANAKEIYGRDSCFAYGVLPWNIQWMQFKLQKAFEARDVNKILKYSSELGHYVSDAHVPLHTTENYNGQLTNQHGIHGLWESRLVEIYLSEYDFFVGKAIFIDQLLDYTWQIIYQSHAELPKVLLLEKIATDSVGEKNKYAFEQRSGQIVKVYSAQFSSIYHSSMENMVQQRMRAAVLAVGSFWFTAWVNAGQPNLKDLVLVKDGLIPETIDSIETYPNSKYPKIRMHEH
ncbi:MAG: zinc dependent phospholipase C family protein [Crocinitomicaceae bacterium]